MTERPRRALVLSGGGSRGAYAAGVVRYVVEEVSEALGRPVRFDIISGTSIGAINATWLAATIDNPDHCVQRLWYLWRTMSLKKAVKPSYENIWTMMRRLLRDTPERSLQPTHGRSYAMLDTRYFAQIVHREIPFHNIRRNIDRNLLDALTVTGTDVHSGRTTVFVQTRDEKLPPWSRDARRQAVACDITPEIVLGSGAIPILFPAVKIGERWFFDGGLRQNTPISPALRMGATKLMVIALKSAPKPPALQEIAPVDTPTVSFLIGKLLNALLLDPLDYDLAFMERINAILQHGSEAMDGDFLEKLNDVIEGHRGQPYRIIDPLLVRPTQDLGQLASDYAGQLSEKDWGNPVLATIGRRAAQNGSFRESDFLSYLLFDGGYTGHLLDLGYKDAAAKHDRLVEFFSD